MKSIAVFLCVVLLSGCANFQNRAYCSADGSEMIAVSKYGPVGLSQELSKTDAEIFCTGAFLLHMMQGQQRR